MTKGFEKKLEITGVGYKAAVAGKNLQLSLGYSHDVNYPIPAGIAIVTPKPTEITITGIDKRQVGQVAAEIRAFAAPSPTRARASNMPANSSSARKARRSKEHGVMAKDQFHSPPQGARSPQRPRARLWQAAFVGVPLVEADLRADHRRRERPHARGRLVARKGQSRGAEDRRQRRGGEGDRQADRRARGRRRASRKSCSIAAPTCITAASRRWPKAPARAACSSDRRGSRRIRKPRKPARIAARRAPGLQDLQRNEASGRPNGAFRASDGKTNGA